MAMKVKTRVTDWLPTRQSLLVRLKNWDDSASWQEFFDRYSKLIYGVAIKAGLSDAEAQEVVQETMVSVSKKMPEFKYDPSIGSFKGWLLHMTHWRINDQLRKRKRDAVLMRSRETATKRTATLEKIPDPAGAGLDEIWEEEWEKNITEMAMDRVKTQVSPKQYQIFNLYVMKKWPMNKISEALGVNMGQIYLAKHRVGGVLKREIKQLESRMI